MLSRNLKILFAIILVVVLPSAAALMWYAVSRDPTVRPLGITKQALDARGADEGSALTIVIRFDPKVDESASEVLGAKLLRAFEAKGVEGQVRRREAQGLEMTVTYKVGTSTLGPYQASKAVSGISAAVGAYRMILPAEAGG